MAVKRKREDSVDKVSLANELPSSIIPYLKGDRFLKSFGFLKASVSKTTELYRASDSFPSPFIELFRRVGAESIIEVDYKQARICRAGLTTRL